MKNKNHTLLIILFIAILPFILFQQAFLKNSLITAGDFSGSDLIDLHLPFKYTLEKNYRNQQIPLWEPNLSLGFPIFAEGQIAGLYPVNIILSFLPTQYALNLSIILAYIAAGVFMFFYAKSINFKNYPALVAAVSFMFSAFFVARIKHLSMIVVSAWTPFLFLCTRNLFKTHKLKYATLAGITVALQILAGHPEMTFFILFIFVVYFFFEFSLAAKKETLTNSLPLALFSFFLIVFIGAGLSAAQILPSLEFTQLTERTEYTFQTATAYPFHPKNLITLISPYYFGNPALGSYQENIQITGIFWENASYLGFVSFLLALWAIIVNLKKKPKNSHLMFFLALAFFSVLLMLGRFTPLYKMLWTLLPGFALFRFPTRFNLFLIFSLSLFAGYGADLLVKKLIRFRHTHSTRAKQEEGRFTWPLKTRPTQAIILATILIDLFVFASSYLAYIPWNDFSQEPEIVKRIKEDSGLFRIYSLTQYGPNPYSAIGWKNDIQSLIDIRKAIPPNQNIFFNLHSFTDRSWFEGGLGTQRRNTLENFITSENQNAVLTGKLLGMYNVKYILTFAEEIGIEVDKIADFTLGKAFAVPLNLFENKQVMPRALFVPQAEVLKEETAILERMKNLEFNPATTVILEDEPEKMPEQFTGILDEFKEKNKVEITDYKDQQVQLKVNISQHGFMILNDIYYPGWKADVDGNSAKILRANYLSRALELDPGEHQIRFYYDPLSFKIGGLVSLSTFTLITLFYLISLIRKLIFRLKH